MTERVKKYLSILELSYCSDAISFRHSEMDFLFYKTMKEVWKIIEGYEDYYLISNLGRIKSLKSKKILRTFRGSLGYIQINLCNNGIYKTLLVHRLLAIAFIPNPENKPQINHIDGIRYNNSLSNLEWCSCSENALHAFKIGLHKRQNGMNAPNRKLDIKDIEFIRYNYGKKIFNQYQLARLFNISNGHISCIINYKRWH